MMPAALGTAGVVKRIEISGANREHRLSGHSLSWLTHRRPRADGAPANRAGWAEALRHANPQLRSVLAGRASRYTTLQSIATAMWGCGCSLARSNGTARRSRMGLRGV